MQDQKELIELEKGEAVNHFLLLRKCEVRLTKSNKEYLSLELGDRSLNISCNLWDNFEEFYKLAIPGQVIKVAGTMDDYQGTPQIKITKIRTAKPADNVKPEDFLPKSKRDINEMKSEFKTRINRINDLKLRDLMLLIFNEKDFDKFAASPAGKAWHHAYVHGLIEHTLEIIRICDLMCDIHPEINRDLLICGAMMHDFGKTEELSPEGSFEYTDKGKLIGHIVISAMRIEEETKNIPGFSDETKNCLIHMILSHQGKLEYASPVVPKTLEAITLYQADELSAKVNAYKNAIASSAGKNGKWTKFIGLASTDLYNHGISPDDEENINKTLFD